MGYKIKTIRLSMKMTQEELAKKSGVSRTIISSLENNKAQNTSTKTLISIATALNTTVDHIFFADGV